MWRGDERRGEEKREGMRDRSEEKMIAYMRTGQERTGQQDKRGVQEKRRQFYTNVHIKPYCES